MTTALQQVAMKAAPRVVPIKNRRARAVRSIRRETGCSHQDAHETLQFIESMVAKLRLNPAFVAYPSGKQLQSRAYAIFEQVIPHGSSAAPDSAHAHIEAAVLDPARDEYGLRHEMREVGSRRYCTVRACLNVMR